MDNQNRNWIIFAAFVLTVFLLTFLGDNITGEAKREIKVPSSMCNDQIDNDGDGKCDYAWRKAKCIDGSIVGDPGCSSKNDNDETNCGDGSCTGSENKLNCLQDCYSCGDNTCDTPYESINNCPVDCAYCGDGICNLDEDCTSCSEDCGTCPPYCGDALCNGDETCLICSTDCGVCPITKPDLIVSQFNINSTTFIENQPFHIDIYVKNIGNAVALGSVNLTLRLYKNGAYMEGIQDAQDLNPGQERLFISRDHILSPGTYNLDAFVDWDYRHDELDETNNHFIRNIIVSSSNSAQFCGDGICNGTETASSCPGDCGAIKISTSCGNGICESGETSSLCPTDCPSSQCVNGSKDGVCREECGAFLGCDGRTPGSAYRCDSTGIYDGTSGTHWCECLNNCSLYLVGPVVCGNGICEGFETTASCPSDCGSTSQCSTTQNGVCPSGCLAGSDYDCCTQSGKCWFSGFGCYDCNNPPGQCSTTANGVCPSGCSAGSDADCCSNAGKCWRAGQGCYTTC